MAKTATVSALLSSAANTAGNTTRSSVLDCSAKDGGVITFALTNGGTGPTVQCEARVMICHRTTTQAAAAEGTGDTDWKQVYVIGSGLTASAKTRGAYRFGPEVQFAYVEFTGNTGQSVTVEAGSTVYAY